MKGLASSAILNLYLEQANRQLKRISVTDRLTGMLNRWGVEIRLKELCG